jgi:hypothetical protein
MMLESIDAKKPLFSKTAQASGSKPKNAYGIRDSTTLKEPVKLRLKTNIIRSKVANQPNATPKTMATS